MRFRILAICGAMLCWAGSVVGQTPDRDTAQRPGKLTSKPAEEVFSGPQAGEKLPALPVRGVLGKIAGKEIDVVKAAGGKPILLVFIHDVNRPSIGLTRILTGYSVSRAKDGLATGVVLLDDDATAAENTLKRISHALTPGAPTAVSLDGREGPGSYGLNRNVTLTILMAKEGKVTANFALVQPSVQVDLPRILNAIVEVVGGTVPKLDELAGMAQMRRAASDEPDLKLRGLIRPVIQRDATAEAVEKAAAAVEEYVKKNEAARREVGRIANTIVESGRLSNYGTERAQEYLRKWAREYGTAKDKGGESDKPARREDK
jgi:hypothetical protein